MTSPHRLRLFIPGPPHGQGRARAGNGRVYTPAETRRHAERVQTEWIAAGRPALPADEPYAFMVISLRRRPASHYTSRGELSAAGRRHGAPGKPDADNELKGLLDALVACGAIPDDRLCWHMAISKRWASPPADWERVVIDAYSCVPAELTEAA